MLAALIRLVVQDRIRFRNVFDPEQFQIQFIGKTAPVAVDVLAGATVTSNAVMEAVNSVLAK